MLPLPRTLEPEVMDAPAEAADYDRMDHSGVNSRFVADFLAVWNRRSPILDIGTGTARIPIEFCGRWPTGTVVAIDLSAEMLRIARDNVDRAGFGGRIELVRVGVRAMPWPTGAFPAIVANSLIHHIPEPATAFAEILRLAAANATIFVRDLLRPNSTAAVEALVDLHARDESELARKLFRESLRASLTLDEVRSFVGALGFASETVRQTSDRHWTWHATHAVDGPDTEYS